MLATSLYRGAWSGRPALASFLSGSSPLPDAATRRDGNGDCRRRCCAQSYSTTPALSSSALLLLANNTSIPKKVFSPVTNNKKCQQQVIVRTIFSTSSFSSLPPEEEAEEKSRVNSLTQYQKEMELRQHDSELARLQTLRAINTGELYTFRGKFKMLSRDYGMGFLAWYWTVWFGTAGLSYLAIEWGGVDPIMVASKVETFLGWEEMSIAGKLDPTIGRIGLVVAMNECLEPLRLPFVVVTTKPVVNFFSKMS